MQEKKYFKIIDENDNEIEYEILLAFKLLKTNKNYIVYTDNEIGIDGKINVYANIYDPKDDTKFDLVETKAEWNEIKKRLNEIGVSNDNE